MHDENYLIICRTSVEASLLLQRVATYLDAHGVTNMRVHKHHGVITTTVPDVKIHFISQAKAYEACRGFHGIIRTGHEVDKFLDQWEETKCQNPITSKF